MNLNNAAFSDSDMFADLEVTSNFVVPSPVDTLKSQASGLISLNLAPCKNTCVGYIDLLAENALKPKVRRQHNLPWGLSAFISLQLCQQEIKRRMYFITLKRAFVVLA